MLDEYDVPLESVYTGRFYNEMAGFIRSLFESTLKTNDSMYFAVVTGCLRISRESGDSGFNNFVNNSIMTREYGEYFGFTEEEVKRVCVDYGISDKYEQLKHWYGGFSFGDKDIYNPKSIMQYVHDNVKRSEASPVSYWLDDNSNRILDEIIDRARRDEKDEIESLIAGETIEKPLYEGITYSDMCGGSMDELWNIMFFMGYLRKISERFEGVNIFVTLGIPNNEVLHILKERVCGWFKRKLKERTPEKLFHAVKDKDTGVMGSEIGKILGKSIVFPDNVKESYHGVLSGFLSGWGNYVVKSNREAGNGRYDLWLKPVSVFDAAYLFEFKVAEKPEELLLKAKEALKQIYDRKYNEEVYNDGYRNIVCFGISFFRKDCVVTVS